MKTKKIYIILSIFVSLAIVLGIYYWLFYDVGSVMMLSVSSDGQYVISSHQNREVVLWNIKNKIFKILSKNANIYSVYFIKNTHDFMWQDIQGFVHIQKVSGKNLMLFYNFPTYGEVITSNLKHYIASNEAWAVFEGIGSKQKPIKLGESGFLGAGKLLNLTLSNDDKYLLTSGWGSDWDKKKLYKGKNELEKNFYAVSKISFVDGVVLWDIATGEPLRKFVGNIAKTFSTFSWDSNYIVSGDEQPRAFVWNALTGKLKFKLWTLWHKSAIKLPKKFMIIQGEGPPQIIAIKFIDEQGHYLRFTTAVPYAILYSIDSPKPLKYLPLGTKPFPSVDNYFRAGSIDTAPKAHLLVMGEQEGEGIIVYQFYPKTFSLRKIWVGSL